MPGYLIYKAATWLARPFLPAFLAGRERRGKEEKSRLGERMGIASLPRPEGEVFWFHAASVGESVSALPVISALLETRPHTHALVTTGTVTSAALMAKRLPPRAFHQYIPADSPAYVRRFLEHWRPDLALWVESELWPNLTLMTRCSKILINARMSEKSAAKWKAYAPGMARNILSGFRLILAQSETDAERFSALGSGNVKFVGNLKYSALPLPSDETELEKMRGELAGRKIWLAASTHEGEEEIIAEAHKLMREHIPSLLTIIIPRHPSRGAGLALPGASLRSKGQKITPQTEFYIADTIGETGLFYRLAGAAFVGGSLVPKGGHNPIEPALLGCPVIFGPHMENFAAIEADFLKSGMAKQAGSAEALAREVSILLSSPPSILSLSAKGQEILNRVLGEINSL